MMKETQTVKDWNNSGNTSYVKPVTIEELGAIT